MPGVGEMDKVEVLRREIQEVLSVARKRGMEIRDYWLQIHVGKQVLIVFLNFDVGVDIKYLKTEEAKTLAAEFICKWAKEYTRRFECEGYRASSTLAYKFFSPSEFVKNAPRLYPWNIKGKMYLGIPKTLTEEEAIQTMSIAKKWLEDMLDDFSHNLLPKLIALGLGINDEACDG